MVVDNTFATPINQQPLALGADLSCTARPNSWVAMRTLWAARLRRRELVAQIYHYREITGAALDPMSAYLLLRGMKTLHLRIRQQNASALGIARFLERHPRVEQVNYPGLDTHPQHASRPNRCAALAAC